MDNKTSTTCKLTTIEFIDKVFYRNERQGLLNNLLKNSIGEAQYIDRLLFTVNGNTIVMDFNCRGVTEMEAESCFPDESEDSVTTVVKMPRGTCATFIARHLASGGDGMGDYSLRIPKLDIETPLIMRANMNLSYRNTLHHDALRSVVTNLDPYVLGFDLSYGELLPILEVAYQSMNELLQSRIDYVKKENEGLQEILDEVAEESEPVKFSDKITDDVKLAYDQVTAWGANVSQSRNYLNRPRVYQSEEDSTLGYQLEVHPFKDVPLTDLVTISHRWCDYGKIVEKVDDGYVYILQLEGGLVSIHVPAATEPDLTSALDTVEMLLVAKEHGRTVTVDELNKIDLRRIWRMD